jgi:hypothetical protein
MPCLRQPENWEDLERGGAALIPNLASKSRRDRVLWLLSISSRCVLQSSESASSYSSKNILARANLGNVLELVTVGKIGLAGRSAHIVGGMILLSLGQRRVFVRGRLLPPTTPRQAGLDSNVSSRPAKPQH